eukprot:SAG31_NODE_9232_length_1312_cov_1.483924_1_plen_250_part_00
MGSKENIVKFKQDPFLEEYSKNCVYCQVFEAFESIIDNQGPVLSGNVDECLPFVHSMAIDVLAGLEVLHLLNFTFDGTLKLESFGVARLVTVNKRQIPTDRTIFKIISLSGIQRHPTLGQQNISRDLRVFAEIVLELLVRGTSATAHDDPAAESVTTLDDGAMLKRTISTAEKKKGRDEDAVSALEQQLHQLKLNDQIREKLRCLTSRFVPESVIRLLAQEFSDDGTLHRNSPSLPCQSMGSDVVPMQV